jgi:tetratricopeptide (TPR) repeat protein
MTEHPHLVAFGEVLKSFRKRQGLTQQQLAAAIGKHRNAISRWEQGDFLPESKATVLELARALRLDDVETQNLLTASFTVQAPLSNVPYPRNPLFTGREELLQSLHRYLSTDQMVALIPSYAVYGLGGIGKTQLAIEYAYRYFLEYSAVLWLQAENEETINASFLALAELLQLPERQESRQLHTIAAVQRWLSTHSRWLLIWDNLEEMALLSRYLPVGHQGKVLITTRRQALGALVHGVELPIMTPEEGMLFLLRRAKVIEPLANAQQVQQVAQRQPGEYAAAEELARIMGGLPLALDQAGAYIEETGCGLAGYLQLYQQHRKQLLGRRGTSSREHPRSTITTFALAYQRMERCDPAAAELLCLCAFLYPDDIPEEMLEAGAECLQEPLCHVVKDLYQFNQAIATLRCLSLVRRVAETRSLSMHRLVQVVLKERMDPTTCRAWAERAVRVVNAAFPDVSWGTVTRWSVCQRYLAHVEVCARLIEQWGIGSLEAARLLNRAGDYLAERAEYEQAEQLLKQGLALCQALPEPERVEEAESFSGLAKIYWQQGKYEQAKELYAAALEACERYLGEEHQKTAWALSNLAVIYSNQGKYAEAELLHMRAIRIRQKLGDEVELYAGFHNIAYLNAEKGKYAEAERFYLRALEVGEPFLGADTPYLSYGFNSLGVLYAYQGRYAEAESLHLRALGMREQMLGPTHPDVAVCLTDLARLYTWQGKYAEAEQLLLRALDIHEQLWGLEEPQAAATLGELGMLRLAQNQEAEAEQFLLRALHLREQQLGEHHPHVALTLDGLAALYARQGRHTEAEALCLRILAIRESRLDPTSPLIASCLYLLAELHLSLERYEEAEAHLLRALRINEQSLGVDHLAVAAVLTTLGTLYSTRQQEQRAREMLERALVIREQRLGSEHPETVKVRASYLRLRQQDTSSATSLG